MAALIITPVSAARFWSDSIQKVYTISLIIGIISAFVGVGFSFYIANAPTGATIVLALTSVFFISAFFAPHKGIIARLYKQFNHKEKTQQENIIKLCFHSIEHILTPELELALETILNNPKFDPHGETIPRIYIY